MKSLQCCVVSTLVVVMLLSAGCTNDPAQGYTTKDQYRPGITTVSVPMWTRGKHVYRRGLEMRITHAVDRQIELDTRYKVTAKSRADTELTGSLDKVVQSVMSVNPDTGRPRDQEITFYVSFEWTDLRSGKILVKKSNFRVTSTYLPSAPLSEDFFQGSEDVINKLAERIVEQMEDEW